MSQTRQIHFDRALVPTGWADDVVLTVDHAAVTKIEFGISDRDNAQHVPGLAIPGMTNVHSHAFQRAFAGLSEFRTAEHDSFWTWRKLMYEYLLKLTPDDVYNIARNLYSEMLASGYTTVGEFHYLHHQVDGTPYREVTAMADAVLLAAVDVGINICLLPVLYERGGFDQSKLEGGQLRFGSTPDSFVRMLEQLKKKWDSNPRVKLGIALHSLRAVSVLSATRIIKEANRLFPDCPIHIHVAEQTREVDDCLAATGRRPVELLMDSFEVNDRWCLIHATHMTESECQEVATSGAVVGVCPTTEANLGDGVFMAEPFLGYGGRLAIGSDSHVSVDPRSELRLLEYAQRLTQRRRAVLCTDQESCGSLLYRWASQGGAQATGFGNGTIAENQPLQITILDEDHPSVSHAYSNQILDTVVFNEVGSPIAKVLTS